MLADNETAFKHPFNKLEDLAAKWKLDVYSEDFAKELDNRKIWPSMREEFHYPKIKDLPNVDISLVDNPDEDCIYFEGNSLGLQPKASKTYVQNELDKWAKIAFYGYFNGDFPWISTEALLKQDMAKLAGCICEEVAIMNTLTINLHLLMISFYRPTEERYKILLEEKAFPSDHYIVESQIELHDLAPKDCMICLKPREGEYTLRTEDILDVIEKEGEKIAVVFLPGVHYFTGQYLDIERITKAAHDKGCFAGWDLAHAIGNVELKLHEWQVDFAAWCTYKYLNSGSGAIGAMFLHKNHFNREDLKRLKGWWGHRLETRFKMDNIMDISDGVNAYHLSNGSMLLYACLKSSLNIIEKVGIKTLRDRSKHLTAYLEAHINKLVSESDYDFEYITPKNPEERGAQISIRFKSNVRQVFKELEKRGVMCDFREPDVLRFAPTPLYNTFSEINRFIKLLKQALLKVESDN